MEISYLGVLLAAVSNMIVGFLWYGPLFGKSWADMMGYKFDTPEAKKEMQKKAMPGYIASFIGALIMAAVLAHFIRLGTSYFPTASALKAGIHTAFWVWLGFVGPITVGSIFWEKRPWKLWLINASYWLVALVAMGVIIVFV